MTLFDYRVELAFEDASETALVWQDITPYVRGDEPVSITRGRSDQLADVAPGRCTVAVNNRDGRFTPGLASSPYYPDVRLGRRLRVRVRYPTGTAGNLIANSTMETDIAGYHANTLLGAAPDIATLAHSSAQAWQGTDSLLVTWPTVAVGSWVGTTATTVVGRTYTASMYVYVPTGSPDPRIEAAFLSASARTSTKDAWVRLSTSFVATGATAFIGVQVATGTAGQTCYVDGVQVDEGSAAVTFTADPPPISDRFTGFVDEWPVSWVNGVTGRATISASDRLKQLGQRRPLRSMLEEQILVDTPGDFDGIGSLYYTLGEPEGATSAASSSRSTAQPLASVAQVGSGGTAEFGAGTGPGTDGLTALILTPSSSTNGKRLVTPGLTNPIGFFGVTLSCWVATSTASREIVRLGFPNDATSYLSLSINGSNKLVGSVVGSGTTLATAASVNNVTGGQTHRGCVTLSASGTTTTLSLYLDDAAAVTATYTGFDGVTFTYQQLIIGGVSGSLFAGTVSHVAAHWSAIDATANADQWSAGSVGAAGERSDQRIARLADYAEIPTAARSFETGLSVSMSAQPLVGQTPLGAMQSVRATENGLLFSDGSDVLVFQSRGHRYGQVSEFTVPAAALAAGDAVVVDDTQLVNDLTVTRPGSSGARVTDEASRAAYGTYDGGSVELLTTSDTEMADAAAWRVNSLSEPRPRLPQVTVNLTTAPAGVPVAAVLAADIGSRFTVDTLPATAPASELDVVVEGLAEQWSAADCAVTFTTTPAEDSGAGWVLDDAVLSVLDATTQLVY